MKTLKRYLCLLIAFVAVLSLAACKKPKNGNGNGTETSDGEPEYEIDFSDRNYEGEDFTVLRVDAEKQHGLTGHPNDIYIEENDPGDRLTNAVWTRNQALSQLLYINISMKMEHNGPQLTRFVEQCIFAGDVYDLVIQEMEFYPGLATKGFLKDLNELNMDTSRSWWDSAAESAFSISDKQYGMVSDIIYLDKLSTVGVFYNTGMAANLQLPDMFAMVDEGDWTFEKMKEYAQLASATGEDVYGISCQNDASYYFLHAGNIRTVVKNSDGEFKYNLSTQRAYNAIEEIFTVMNEKYFFNRQSKGLTVDETVKMFEQQTMFLVRPLQSFYYLKNYSDTYGVLPMPKLDSQTDGYYSAVNHHVATFIAVPFNNNQNDRTADVLQAWGMISKKIVMPELYDVVLSLQMVKEPNSARMLDIILNNKVYDIGFIWNFGSIESTLVLSNEVAIQRAPGTVGSDMLNAKKSVEDDIAQYTEKK